MADSEMVRELPLPLRALLATNRVSSPYGRRIAIRLAARPLDGDVLYRTPMGFAIKVAPTDRVFQPSMALGLFEPHVMAAVRAYARPGSVAIDAFGHVGYFTLMLAQAVGPEGGVETYECDPRLAPRIAQHVSVNDMSGIVNVNEVAVWDVDGEEVELKIVEMPGWSYLEEGMWEPVATVRVPSVTCDEHLRRRNIDPATVSFVKLDVEGAEVRARPVWNGCSARATPQS